MDGQLEEIPMDEQVLEFDELLAQIKSDVKQVVAEIGTANLPIQSPLSMASRT